MSKFSTFLTHDKTKPLHYLYNEIPMFVFEPINIYNIDLNKVINYIETTVPQIFASGIDYIDVGYCGDVNKKSRRYYLKDKILYITDDQRDEMSMIKDIIHGFAFSSEIHFRDYVYADSLLLNEFLKKRVVFFNRVKLLAEKNGLGVEDFLNIEYNVNFYNFMFMFPLTRTECKKILKDVFIDPYDAVTLRNYYVGGIHEMFVNKNMNNVVEFCPNLYKVFNYIYKLSESVDYISKYIEDFKKNPKAKVK